MQQLCLPSRVRVVNHLGRILITIEPDEDLGYFFYKAYVNRPNFNMDLASMPVPEFVACLPEAFAWFIGRIKANFPDLELQWGPEHDCCCEHQCLKAKMKEIREALPLDLSSIPREVLNPNRRNYDRFIKAGNVWLVQTPTGVVDVSATEPPKQEDEDEGKECEPKDIAPAM
jgi:hypothetical protein